MTEPQATLLFISMFLFLIAGLFEGTAEALKFHTSRFFDRFKKANKQFWDPSLSWRNKYKNGDPAQGTKFPFSTSGLVFLTDGYHLVRWARNVFTIAAIIISPALVAWYMYIAAFVLFYLAFTGGFTISYDRLF